MTLHVMEERIPDCTPSCGTAVTQAVTKVTKGGDPNPELVSQPERDNTAKAAWNFSAHALSMCQAAKLPWC